MSKLGDGDGDCVEDDVVSLESRTLSGSRISLDSMRLYVNIDADASQSCVDVDLVEAMGEAVVDGSVSVYSCRTEPDSLSITTHLSYLKITLVRIWGGMASNSDNLTLGGRDSRGSATYSVARSTPSNPTHLEISAMVNREVGRA